MPKDKRTTRLLNQEKKKETGHFLRSCPPRDGLAVASFPYLNLWQSADLS
jgi:hypothetical protein